MTCKSFSPTSDKTMMKAINFTIQAKHIPHSPVLKQTNFNKFMLVYLCVSVATPEPSLSNDLTVLFSMQLWQVPLAKTTHQFS